MKKKERKEKHTLNKKKKKLTAAATTSCDSSARLFVCFYDPALVATFIARYFALKKLSSKTKLWPALSESVVFFPHLALALLLMPLIVIELLRRHNWCG